MCECDESAEEDVTKKMSGVDEKVVSAGSGLSEDTNSSDEVGKTKTKITEAEAGTSGGEITPGADKPTDVTIKITKADTKGDPNNGGTNGGTNNGGTNGGTNGAPPC